MYYTDEQCETTKNYIHLFFAQRPNNKYHKVRTEFTRLLDSTFKQIQIFMPEMYEFSNQPSYMASMKDWISEHIEPFPEELIIVLSKDGESYHKMPHDKFVICEKVPPVKIDDKKENIDSLKPEFNPYYTKQISSIHATRSQEVDLFFDLDDIVTQKSVSNEKNGI